MSTLPERPRRVLLVLGGIAYIAAIAQYALAQVVSAAAWHPPYSWTRDFISDLGNTACGPFAVPHGQASYVCSPDHQLMNASFVVSGVLTVVGTLLVAGWWPARRLTRVALALWLASGVLKMVVGFVPENTGVGLHLLGALNIPLGSIAILLLSLSVFDRQRAMAVFGFAVAVVGLAGTVLSTGAQYAGAAFDLGFGNGGMERVASYPGSLWLLVFGVISVGTTGLTASWSLRRAHVVTS